MIQETKKRATLIKCFEELRAPRIERCRRHKLIDIVIDQVLRGVESAADRAVSAAQIDRHRRDRHLCGDLWW